MKSFINHEIINNNSVNKSEKQIINSQVFYTPLATKGRNLLEEFDKTAIKNQNEITANKKINNSVQVDKKNNDSKNNKNDYMNDKKIITPSTNKFFTECGLGYRCSCGKTRCSKQYCECYKEGRYCLNCNCTDCENKQPKNYSSNRHPKKETDSNQKSMICCTCTKSGCNKKYCECYKNGNFCSNSCRCIQCENRETKKYKNNFECCLANSVLIVDNKIYEFEVLGSKRKRGKKKNLRGVKIKDNKELDLEKSSESEEILGFFDKDGKIILKNLLLSEN